MDLASLSNRTTVQDVERFLIHHKAKSKRLLALSYSLVMKNELYFGEACSAAWYSGFL